MDTGRWRVASNCCWHESFVCTLDLVVSCGFCVCFKSWARVTRRGRASLELLLRSAELQPIKIRTQKETGTQKTPDILILILILTLILCMGFPRIQGFNF